MTKLFVSDIDNTLIPQLDKQDPRVLEEFGNLLRQHDITFAYASGRHLQLILDSIAQEHLPVPDYIISNVGTMIHSHSNGDWQIEKAYDDLLSQQWHSLRGIQIHNLLTDISYLERQEPEVQFDFKQSYYVDTSVPDSQVVDDVEKALKQHHIQAKVMYSVDQVKKIGLVDVLPARSGKDGALMYLADKFAMRPADVVFAGDSGNDITALSCGAKGILVANAREQVKEILKKVLQEKHLREQVYFSKAKYVAGVVEGLKHHGLMV